MNRSVRRITTSILALALTVTAAFTGTKVADAGLATSVGLVATLSYSGSTGDLIPSFRLVNRTTGRVEWQAAAGDIVASTPQAGVVRYTTNLLAGDWNYSSSYEWSCRIDARGASSAVYWSSFKQWVDAVEYSAGTLPSGNISGTTSEALLLGQIEDYLL
jgi:hypothetical protein